MEEETVPIGFTVIWGEMKSGKTLASLNSPYRPVYIIDVENSAHDYEQHMDKLIEQNILRGIFTRYSALDYNSFKKVFNTITNSEKKYRTIILDTAGQYTTWVADDLFERNKAQADKMSQVVWGKVRNKIRQDILALQLKCDLLIYTAHSREFRGVTSPRANPALLEMASVSIEIRKQINQAKPNAQITARVPFFPPRIERFDLDKLVAYVDKPADWNNLKPEEKIEPPPPVTYTDEEEK